MEASTSNASTIKRKRGADGVGQNKLTVGERYKLICSIENEEITRGQAAKLAGVARQSVYTMMKPDNVKRIKQQYERGMNMDTKRVSNGLYPELEDRLLRFIEIVKREAIYDSSHAKRLVTQQLIQEQAKREAAALNIQLGSFSASSGWFLRFKNRYGLAGASGLFGEDWLSDRHREQRMDSATKETIKASQHDADHIFIAAESMLFHQMFPRIKSPYPPSGRPGELQQTGRCSFLAAYNVSGRWKTPLSVIVEDDDRADASSLQQDPPAMVFPHYAPWVDSIVAQKWFDQVFVPFVKKTTSKHVLLLWNLSVYHLANHYQERVHIVDISRTSFGVLSKQKALSSYLPPPHGHVPPEQERQPVPPPPESGAQGYLGMGHPSVRFAAPLQRDFARKHRTTRTKNPVQMVKHMYKRYIINHLRTVMPYRDALFKLGHRVPRELRGIKFCRLPTLLDVLRICSNLWEDLSKETVVSFHEHSPLLPDYIKEMLEVDAGGPKRTAKRLSRDFDTLVEDLAREFDMIAASSGHQPQDEQVPPLFKDNECVQYGGGMLTDTKDLKDSVRAWLEIESDPSVQCALARMELEQLEHRNSSGARHSYPMQEEDVEQVAPVESDEAALHMATQLMRQAAQMGNVGAHQAMVQFIQHFTPRFSDDVIDKVV